MLRVCTLLVLCGVVFGAHHSATTTTTPKPRTDHQIIQDLEHENTNLRRDVEYMKRNVEDLTRQVMLQQTFVEERIRSDGSSGLKQVRVHHAGTRPYYTGDFADSSVAGIHEHSSNIRTIGMGELNVVLNGVEFRTRHNDYRLRMPVTDDKTYNKVKDIPYPDVPPQVLNKATVPEQVAEMREWFKAFKNQDHSVRDYRKYFKPVLCYMEGGWTTNTKTLEEPFFSDRHFIDASSWFDLQDKVRYTSYSGGKSNLENFAYLPTTIMNVVNGTPEYAQWNYRIVCHPLNDDLPTNVFMLQDDLTVRMSRGLKMDQVNNTRLARYTLRARLTARHRDGMSYGWGLLDDLMYQIPGKDNYGVNITDAGLGLTLYDIRQSNPLLPLNTANYHRYYKVEEKDAMGQKNVKRGFSDPNLFAAQTTSAHISPLSMTNCEKHRDQTTHHMVETCTPITERYTWAIPLEVIYMTPLLKWNPYNLHHVYASSGKAIYDVVHGPNGTRNGGLNPEKAYNGTHNKAFYRTPAEFFSTTKAVGADRADTAKGSVGVLDRHGVVRNTMASGTRIVLPAIDGIGRVRTRYPIMPLHNDGNPTKKEVDALKDMVMRMPTYSSLFEEEPTTVSNANALHASQPHLLKVAQTTRDPPGLHSHDVLITQGDIDDMKNGDVIKGLLTSVDNSHQHSIDIRMNQNDEFIIDSCDGMSHCWDGHDNHLTMEY
ncbi:hypothetical protein ACF0H5_001435 [Mactra antiquata]